MDVTSKTFLCSTISTLRAGVSSAWRVCLGSDPSPLPLLSCLGTDSFLLPASSLALPTKGAAYQTDFGRSHRPEEINSRWVSGGGVLMRGKLTGQVGRAQVCAETGDTLCGHILPSSQGTSAESKICKLGL